MTAPVVRGTTAVPRRLTAPRPGVVVSRPAALVRALVPAESIGAADA
ncbi:MULTISPECIES: hypothetical protein [Streptomyces]|nr:MULTISPECIES: hypothetical protein [Streptomyces]